MNVEELREYILQKENVTESFPFNDSTLVFKVKSKIFTLISLNDEFKKIGVKCNPELAVKLREKYSFVEPAYHMNKKHWNSVIIKYSDDNFLKEQIDNSYDLVFSSLPKYLKEEIKQATEK